MVLIFIKTKLLVSSRGPTVKTKNVMFVILGEENTKKINIWDQNRFVYLHKITPIITKFMRRCKNHAIIFDLCKFKELPNIIHLMKQKIRYS